MSKLMVEASMDAVEIDGVTEMRIEDIRQESNARYRRSIIITTDMGDFRITVRAKTEAPLRIKVPARLTL